MNQTSQSSSSDEDIFLKYIPKFIIRKQNLQFRTFLNLELNTGKRTDQKSSICSESYMVRKINKKTELCNNYVVKGSCRYGNNVNANIKIVFICSW